jgi:HlyD family secretion protein
VKKRLVRPVVGVIVVVLVLLVAACGTGRDQEAVEVETALVTRGSLTSSINAIGSVNPRAEVALSFEVPGRISQVLVQAGDRVEKDQPLVRLDTRDLDLQVKSAEAALAAAQAQLEQLEAGARPEEIVIAQANLDAAEASLAGAEISLQELEAGPDPEEVVAAEAELRAAQAGVQAAAAERDQVMAGASQAEIAAAEAQLATAQAQKEVAQDLYDQTLRCQTVTAPDGSQREVCPGLGAPEEQARANLTAAIQAVNAAQSRLNQLLAGATPEQVRAAQANYDAALARQDVAQARLDSLQAGASTAQIETARSNVLVLESQRDVAQAQLDLLVAGAISAEIATARAGVAQAEVALESAQRAVEKAILKAPLDGVIIRIDAEPGEYVGPQIPVITVIDDSQFRIEVDVDETDIGWVQVGQEVLLTLDAFPGRELAGRVVAIAPAATLDLGIVTYQLSIETEPVDLPLRVGLTASAEIIMAHKEDVLLVPNLAIAVDPETGQQTVFRETAGGVQETVIETGLATDLYSEVLSGLGEGDQVVINSFSDQDQFRELMSGYFSSRGQ